MKRAVLVASMAQPDAHFKAWVKSLKLKSSDLLIAVDLGVEILLRAGLTPSFAVGDWDSIGAVGMRALRRIPHLTLPRSKDRSDLFYGLEAAQDFEVERILCAGVTGGRADHHLANLMDLGNLAARIPITSWSSEAEFHFVSAQVPWRVRLSKRALVSIFAWQGPALGVSLRGFCYSMKGARLEPSSHGLSNLVSSGQVEVRLKKGLLLVVVPQF